MEESLSMCGEDTRAQQALRQRQETRATALVLLFIACALFLPSEPFLFAFLESKGLTKEQINDEVFGLWIYARLPALLVVGLAAECVGPAFMVLIGSVCGTVTVFLTWCSTELFWIQVTQLTVAASDAAHNAALFALVVELSTGHRQRQRNVHWAKATLLLSSFAASLTGNAMVNGHDFEYGPVWEVSLVAQIVATTVALALVFQVCCVSRPLLLLTCRMRLLLQDVVRSLTSKSVLEWVLFTIVAHTAHIMVATYWQSLMFEITGKQKHNDNGLISGSCYCLSSVVLISSSKVSALSKRENRRKIIAWALLFNGLMALGMGLATQGWQLAFCYICYEVVFEVGSASFLLQFSNEVDVVLVESAVGARSGRLPEAGRQPPMALLLGLANFVEACCESLVQYGFKHARTEGGKPIPMPTRFVVLGLGMSCITILAIGLMAISKLRRRG